MMSVLKYTLWAAFVGVTVGLPNGNEPRRYHDNYIRAKVVLGNGVHGTLHLSQHAAPGSSVHIEGKIYNLTPGPHGFHIHTSGDLSDGCASAGGHYNPTMMNHGSPDDYERHVGDLGNIYANYKGRADVNIIDHLVTLVGSLSVVDRAVVIHEGKDDLGRGGNASSLTTGNSGSRVGCGVIKTV